MKPADAELARLVSAASLERLRLLWDGPFPATLQDASFRLVAVNAAYERFTGLPRDTLIGLDPIALHPEDDRLFDAAWREAVRGGSGGELLESRIVGAGGRERWFRAVMHAVDGPAGERLVVTLLQDATAEHAARERADRGERELDHWFDLSPAGMALYDEAGLLLRSNPAFELLVGHAPVLLADAPAPLQELLAWRHGAPHPELVPDGPAVETRGTVVLPDGHRQRLRARVRALRTGRGALRVMAALEDQSHEDEQDLAQMEMGALMDTAGVGVATFDPQRGWLRSRAPRGRRGGANGALQSISRDLVEPSSLPEYERLQRALKAGESAEVRYAVRHPELGRRWLRTRIEPGQLSGGRRAASVVTIDVTDEQLLAERGADRPLREQLLLQSERTRAILDSVLVGIVTVGEGGIEWMNRSARRMFGGDLADFVGVPIAVVATGEPDHPLRRTEHYLQTLSDGQAETFECRLQALDGRTFWVVGNAVVTGRESGGARQLTFALLDIERRRQAEDRIAQTQASLERIIETAPMAIMLFDAAGPRVLQLNQRAAAVAGRTIDAALGRTPRELFDAGFAEALADGMLAAVRSRAVERRDIPRGDQDWDLRIAPLTTTGEAPEQLLVVATDVTEQRRAERARYDAAIEQRERLVQEVHHRIKNNLQGVAGLMQQIAQRRPEVAPVIAEAIGQVQAIAQVYGLQVGSTGPLRVKSVVEAIAASVQRQYGRAIALDVLGQPHRWALPEAESIPIALTVNELLTNAHKHGTGPVRCTLRCNDDDVQLSIANPGRLPDGFDLSRVPGGVSGLGLVRALLPRRSAALTLAQHGPDVVAAVTLTPPGVKALEPL